MKKSDKSFPPGLKIVALVLAAATVWLCSAYLFPSIHKTKPAGSSEAEITRDILYAYCQEQAPSSEQLETLLKSLEDTNIDAAGRWRKILDCWREATPDYPLNEGSLPDGLDSSNQLCLIVLGFQLNPDGSMQDELIGRLETALKSAQKYPDAYILCTGGGTASKAPTITEADAMAQWLLEHGIGKERIIVENQSLTTSQNAIFSYQLLSQNYPGITQAAIISSDYHIPWGTILFQAKFLLEDYPITVVSNAAYHTNVELNSKALLRYQLNGLLEIAGIS